MAVALGFAACATRSPPPLAVPRTPAAALAHIREQERTIATLRARFTATTDQDGQQRRAAGVLLVEKPDRFRLRLFLPFGFTLFDYLSIGERTWVTAAADTSGQAQPDGNKLFSREDFGQAFLRGPDAFPGDCAPESEAAQGEATIVCRTTAGTVRTVRVDLATSTIIDETSYDAGSPRMAISYSDYRRVAAQDGRSFVLPFRIAMRYPARGVNIDIAIEHYEVNLSLPASMFAPPEGAGS